MTTTETKALEVLRKQIRWPSATAAEYETQDGALVQTSRNEDAARLLDSDDYKAGWHACRAKVDEVLHFLMTGDARDVRRYARQ